MGYNTHNSYTAYFSNDYTMMRTMYDYEHYIVFVGAGVVSIHIGWDSNPRVCHSMVGVSVIRFNELFNVINLSTPTSRDLKKRLLLTIIAVRPCPI